MNIVLQNVFSSIQKRLPKNTISALPLKSEYLPIATIADIVFF